MLQKAHHLGIRYIQHFFYSFYKLWQVVLDDNVSKIRCLAPLNVYLPIRLNTAQLGFKQISTSRCLAFQLRHLPSVL